MITSTRRSLFLLVVCFLVPVAALRAQGDPTRTFPEFRCRFTLPDRGWT